MFIDFPKIPRLSRDCVVTEKIDGTNASIWIEPQEVADPAIPWLVNVDGHLIAAGSRTKFITPTDDNFGFAKWVLANAEELFKLGDGRHYGEWWGSGIQRGYGLVKGEKRFSLFNTHRWNNETKPACCSVVPVLYTGLFDTAFIQGTLTLLGVQGSHAAPGFMKPEGIIIYHTAGNLYFKKTLEKDNEWKGKA